MDDNKVISGGIAKTKVMDTVDSRDGETGEGLSTEKQNITSAVCVCECMSVYMCQGKATNQALV